MCERFTSFMTGLDKLICPVGEVFSGLFACGRRTMAVPNRPPFSRPKNQEKSANEKDRKTLQGWPFLQRSLVCKRFLENALDVKFF